MSMAQLYALTKELSHESKTFMFNFIFFIVTIVSAYIIGNYIEQKHYSYLKHQENKQLFLPTVTAQHFLEENHQIKDARLVSGSVVISIDYFKRVMAALRNIFGGEVISYETVIDRARREAILRMKKEAKDADIIVNMRIETSTIGNNYKKNSIAGCEVLAYGTAIFYQASLDEKIKHNFRMQTK
jgi:uncharacterized protein YbjQ (UPF0145 family)